MNIIMHIEDDVFPEAYAELSAKLSMMISRGMSSAYLLGANAQACVFADELELAKLVETQGRARAALTWRKRIVAMAQEKLGAEALHARLLHIVQRHLASHMLVAERHVVEVVHAELQRTTP